MSRIAIDTNVLIRYMINDLPEQTILADRVIHENCTEKHPGFISLLVCVELDYVLRQSYKYPRVFVYEMLINFLNNDSFEVEDSTLLMSILNDYLNTGADLADLILAEVALNNGCETTMTFDKKASKTKGFTLIK